MIKISWCLNNDCQQFFFFFNTTRIGPELGNHNLLDCDGAAYVRVEIDMNGQRKYFLEIWCDKMKVTTNDSWNEMNKT